MVRDAKMLGTSVDPTEIQWVDEPRGDSLERSDPSEAVNVYGYSNEQVRGLQSRVLDVIANNPRCILSPGEKGSDYLGSREDFANTVVLNVLESGIAGNEIPVDDLLERYLELLGRQRITYDFNGRLFCVSDVDGDFEDNEDRQIEILAGRRRNFVEALNNMRLANRYTARVLFIGDPVDFVEKFAEDESLLSDSLRTIVAPRATFISNKAAFWRDKGFKSSMLLGDSDQRLLFIEALLAHDDFQRMVRAYRQEEDKFCWAAGLLEPLNIDYNIRTLFNRTAEIKPDDLAKLSDILGFFPLLNYLVRPILPDPNSYPYGQNAIAFYDQSTESIAWLLEYKRQVIQFLFDNPLGQKFAHLLTDRNSEGIAYYSFLDRENLVTEYSLGMLYMQLLRSREERGVELTARENEFVTAFEEGTLDFIRKINS